MIPMIRFAVLVILLSFVLPEPAEADRRVPLSREQIQLSYAPLVRKAAPAVVNIYTRKVVRTRQVAPLFDDPFFRRFFGEEFGRGLGRTRKKVQNSLGSGVILRPDGLIVTNEHVIEGADEITVVLSDRREFQAKIVGSDDKTDLAILRIDTGGETLPHLDMRNSDELEVGDLVLAIGNPFGVGQTVTSGIVSAMARNQTGISDLGSFIQTDAAINPGNSGGALVGMDGRLVGINTAIFSKTGGSMGIGFATPSNMVRSVVAGLTATGRVVRPWLGVTSQTLTPDIASSLGLRRPIGVLINQVQKGGSAAKAGIRTGDVVLEVDGKVVETPHDLRFRLATMAIGDRVTFLVMRRGSGLKLTAKLVAPPEIPPRDETELEGNHPLSGAVVANISPALSDEIGLEGADPGVIILKIRRSSVANRMGFRPMDRVTEVNGRNIEDVAELKRRLAKAKRKGWQIEVQRGKKTLELVINR